VPSAIVVSHVQLSVDAVTQIRTISVTCMHVFTSLNAIIGSCKCDRNCARNVVCACVRVFVHVLNSAEV
jgi:hypothetical protein